eukprot:TRINITY_DN6772_c0_g1_i9.p2 TRINITY_DN6772_c0_g1~~TRINITY_DN6772_c0_g1_i9.p2  ORF type:complete len:221 (-),score=38.75 TRINITY_DN6772_c0_g1_i9:136-798(-)
MSEIPQPSSLEKKLIEDFLPDHNNLVMSGLLAAIGDKQLLVQRSALDLTIKLFPLHSNILASQSLPILLSPILQTLLRQEASLTRRVFSYILGPSEPQGLVSKTKKKPKSCKYFLQYSRENVIESFKLMLQEVPLSSSAAINTFRLFGKVVEKQEIGEHLISDVLVFLVQSLHKYKEGLLPFGREVIPVLSSFLDDLKADFVWNFLCDYSVSSVGVASRE